MIKKRSRRVDLVEWKSEVALQTRVRCGVKPFIWYAQGLQLLYLSKLPAHLSPSAMPTSCYFLFSIHTEYRMHCSDI